MPYVDPIVKQMSRIICFFQGPKFYNPLDSEIIKANSIFSFKKALKNKNIKNYE